MKFSKRTAWPSGENAWTSRVTELKKNGRVFLDLTESNPTRAGFSFFGKNSLEALTHPANLIYEPDSHGLLAAREAVSAYYRRKNIEVRADRIFLTAGTSEAYAHLFRLLLEPKEKVLVPEPGYPLFGYLSDLTDSATEKYPVVYDKGWGIDARFLKKTPGKAILVVNPSNPTGQFVSSPDRNVVNDWAVANGAAILSDEVFLDFPIAPDAAPKSFADNKDALTFTLSGISKILGLPQMKLSWIIVSGPEEAAWEAARRLEIIADTFLSVNTPVQRALPQWLDSQNATEAIRSRVSANYGRLAVALSKHPLVELLKTEGGWHGVLLLGADRSDEAAALCLAEAGILVHPGYFYDFSGGSYLVLSLLPETSIFDKAVTALALELSKAL